ncbi:hypothetical protein MASR2M78_21960 [Treponema sp.]
MIKIACSYFLQYIKIMPSQILHSLFGEDLLVRLAERLELEDRIAAAYAKTLIEVHPGVFALGCQGPDLFYHSQHRRPVALEYGTLLHRRAYGNFVEALLRLAILETKTDLIAYALGFASHAFLDRASHPYIVCKAGWVIPSKPETLRYARCHAFFERILDVLMLDRLRKLSASDWDQEGILSTSCDTPPEALPSLIETALKKAFPKRAGKDEKLKNRIDNAFADSASFYRYTSPVRTSLKHWHHESAAHFATNDGRSSLALIYPEEFPSNIDYLNLGGVPWPHPCAEDKLDSLSFPDIYEQAIQSALPLFHLLVKSLSRAASIDSIAVSEAIGNQGLSILNAQGQPCSPLYASPLPLDLVLDAQYTLRMASLEKSLD